MRRSRVIGGAGMNQIRTCVSNNSERGSDVLDITSPFVFVDRADDIAADFGGSGHVTKKIYRFFLYGHELRDRFPSLCDDDRPALLCHLIDQAQAVGLEFRRRNPFLVHNLKPPVIFT
jgi:hypothetical protein